MANLGNTLFCYYLNDTFNLYNILKTIFYWADEKKKNMKKWRHSKWRRIKLTLSYSSMTLIFFYYHPVSKVRYGESKVLPYFSRT